MTHLLHIDSSPRALLSGRSGSHTRRLSARFVARWSAAARHDPVTYRDVGISPPAMVTGAFVEAAFTQPALRTPAMRRTLAESDQLVDELIAADLIVAGVPMYNFNVPAQLKAYIDNVVRVGRTFGFDRAREGVPYFPMLPAGKTLVVLGARGDYGYDPQGRIANMNHAEPSIRTAFAYIGITDIRAIAIEYDEFPRDPRHAASIESAEAAVDALVDALLGLKAGAQLQRGAVAFPAQV